MLRRSKSQTSLTRKAAQGCVSSVDCRHCMAEGVAIINSHIKQAADQQLGTGHSLQQPHIERRGGLNSTGYRSGDGGGAEGGFREAAKSYRQCRGLDAQEINQRVPHCPQTGMRTAPTERARKHFVSNDENACRCSAVGGSVTPNTNQARLTNQLSTLNLLKLINEVDKAIQNAMFIAQHIDNLDEFESVKENWKYIAMVIDRIFLIVFLFICIVGTVAIFATVPWTYYLNEKPIDLSQITLDTRNLTGGDTMKHGP
uniref:Neuronal acetylcholine receptor subunit alpha-4 n=1 Tax=Aceria tosichella TaxID=561515 RepID=A0A6G1SFK3_9ACAR